MTAIVIPNVFLPSTTISSTAMNANFTAVANAIDASMDLAGTEVMIGQLQGANGTAGAPSFSFGTDLNVGMYRKAVDELGFSTAGTLRMWLDSAGKGWFAGALDVATSLHVATTFVVDGASTLTGATTVGSTLGVTGVLSALSTLELGNASDTTLARSSAGNVTIEGNIIYRAGGTDVAVADGGTGASTATAARINLGAIQASGVFPGCIIATIEDQKGAGTASQDLTGSTDNVRDLTATPFNRDSAVSLAANRFTLQAGTWLIRWVAPASSGVGEGTHQSFLFNQTDSTVVARGTSGLIDGGSASTIATTDSTGAMVVTIASAKAFEIRHRPSTTLRGGLAANVGFTEVYTRVEIYAA